MSKNAAVRIKRRLSRARSNSLVSVASRDRSKRSRRRKFCLLQVQTRSKSKQDQTRFPLPVAAGREVTNLTGLRPTVSMVGYTVAVVLAFPTCINIERNLFSPPPDKLGAANRETVSKSN